MPRPVALIVEDDEMLADIFSRTLRAGNFDTIIAADGSTALARLVETVPDVVILDLHLPHMAGSHILAQIRADERLTRTKVILSTADYRLADTLRDQADLVLLKPVSPDQVRMLALRLVSNQGD